MMDRARVQALFRGCRQVGRAAVGALDTLCFPPRCQGCDAGEPTTAAGGIARWLCADCLRSAEGERIVAPCCAVCSAPCDGAIVGPGEFVCAHCRGRRFAFVRATAARRSRGLVHEAIIRFKYHGDFARRHPLAHWLGEALTRETTLRAGGTFPDALVPVPLHASRRRERGFNQAAVLARLAGRAAGVPVWEGALRRVRQTRTQTGLGHDDRQSNLRDAFAVPRPADVRGRRVLLVDDVFTTGATAHECARTLRGAGAAEVSVIVVARR